MVRLEISYEFLSAKISSIGTIPHLAEEAFNFLFAYVQYVLVTNTKKHRYQVTRPIVQK